ncbi:MAG: efflux RND transporter periplasmic adaptor subunit [Dokdonella sp.]
MRITSTGKSVRALAMSIALVALAACGGKVPPPLANLPPPALESTTLHAQALPTEQAWDGVVEAVNQVVIAAQTNARVVELPYDVNDNVDKGAVLVRFSDVEQKSARAAAQAQIAAAQAAYAEALASYDRFAAIFPKGFVAKAQLDQERARRDAALAALQSARAQFNQTDQQLDYTVLRAPYAGIITRRYVHVGEAVQAGPPTPQPLIALVSLDDLRVTVQVPQSAVAAIRQFNAAEVVLDGGRRVAATKVTVFPYADPNTHSFSVRLELSGDLGGLYPGVTVKVAFANGNEKRMLVPDSALVRRGELVGAYVLGEHAVALRQVRTGLRYGDNVEVLAGLEDGQRIVTDPAAAARWLTEHQSGAKP